MLFTYPVMQAEVAVHKRPGFSLWVSHVNACAEHDRTGVRQCIEIGPQSVLLDTETVQLFAGMTACASAKSFADGNQQGMMPRLLRTL